MSIALSKETVETLVDESWTCKEMDRALWCHLFWLDTEIYLYNENAGACDRAGNTFGGTLDSSHASVTKENRDNLIANLDRAWGPN